MKRGMQATLSGVLALAALALCAGPGFAQTTNASGSNSTANSGSNFDLGREIEPKPRPVGHLHPNHTGRPDDPRTCRTSTGQASLPRALRVCLGSVSAGGAGAGLGVTIGGTIVDQECQLRDERADAGDPRPDAKAAREEMCVDPQVRAAMAAAGTPCVADESAKPQATAEYEGPAPAASRRPRRAAATKATNCWAVGTTSARLARRRPMRRSQRLRPSRRSGFSGSDFAGLGAADGDGLHKEIPVDWRLV